MNNPQIERILLQLKFTLACERGTPETRQVLALNQVNNALRDLSREKYAACDQTLHIRHTNLDQPVRTAEGDVLCA